MAFVNLDSEDLKNRVVGVKCVVALPNACFALGLDCGVVHVWTNDGTHIAVFSGHTNWVTSLAVLPHYRLASGSGDMTIKLWSIPMNRKSSSSLPTLTMTGHSDWVNCLIALPNGNLVSGGGDHLIKVWNVSDGSCIRTLSGHEHWVVALTMLPNNHIASGSKDQRIRIWDITSGRCLTIFDAHTNGVRCLAMLSDGHLASSGDDTNIKLWSIEGKRCVATLSGHRKKVTCLQALPNDQLASASEDGNLKLWSGKANKTTCVLTKKANDDKIKAITFLTNGRLVTSTDSTITLHVLNPLEAEAEIERETLRCSACHCEFESQAALALHIKSSKSCRPRGGVATATAAAGSSKSSSSAGGATIAKAAAQELGPGLGFLSEFVAAAGAVYHPNTTTKIMMTQSRPEKVEEVKEIKVNKQVILIIDKSGSMQLNDKWAKALNGCRKVLMKLDAAHDWAGFYTFNQTVTCELPVTFLSKDVTGISKGKEVQRKFRDEFNSHIGLLMNTSPEGGTALNDAIYQASTAFVQPKSKGFKVQLELVVLTDGEDCRSSCTENALNRHLRELKATNPWMNSLHLTILGVDIEADATRKMATVVGHEVGEVIDVSAGGSGIVDTFREVIESRIATRSMQLCVEVRADQHGNVSVLQNNGNEGLAFSMPELASSLPAPPPHKPKSKHTRAEATPQPPRPSPPAAATASASTIRTCRGCNMRFQDKGALQSHLQLNPQCKTKK